MNGYITNIEKTAVDNTDFRRVLYTAPTSQLVVMCLKPGEEIGEETHENVDQFFRIEEGEGKTVIHGVDHPVGAGFAIVIPAGTKHNIVNTGSGFLKLYTVYSPPNHKDGVVHATRAVAEADTADHYDGKTTEV